MSTVYTRDGKALDVDLTLRMAQEHISLMDERKRKGRISMDESIQQGLAMALEAALIEVKRRDDAPEPRSTHRKWWWQR